MRTSLKEAGLEKHMYVESVHYKRIICEITYPHMCVFNSEASATNPCSTHHPPTHRFIHQQTHPHHPSSYCLNLKQLQPCDT